MARIPSNISTALSLHVRRPSPTSPFSLLTLRHRSSSSSSSNQGSLSELDLSSSASSSSTSTSSSSSSSSDDTEAIGLRKLEEAVHTIMVMKSTPDWIHFIPGSSFWVPPRKRPIDVEELLGKLAATAPSFEDDLSSSSCSLSVTTARGWPCFEALLAQLDGAYPQPGPVEVEVEVEVEVSNHDKLEVKVLSTSETSGSGDNEGSA